MATPTSSQIVDDFENSFQACLAALTNPDYFNVRDSEEVKTGVEQTIQRFLDLAKQMECFFLQKRLLLSVQKPEHIVLENNSELKNELARKEQLLNKYYDKIQTWQSLLKEVSGAARPPPPPPQAQPPQNIAQQPQQQQQQPQQSQQQQQQQPQMPMMQGPPMQNVGPPQPGTQGHPHHMMPPHCMPQQQPMTSSGGSIVLQSAPQMHPQPHMGPGQQQQQQQQGGLPGPLAYLERTMSNIGIPDGRG